MKTSFCVKFAFDNLRKNHQIYFPFILSNAGIIGMMYIVASLSANESLLNSYHGNYILPFLEIGRYVIVLFSVIFLFYTNSFAIKRRRSELGLYNVLGLEKKHIIKIVFYENLICFLTSLFIGLVLGFIFEKIAFLTLVNLVGDDLPFGELFSFDAVTFTFIVFLFIYTLLFIYSALAIHKSKPLELLKEKSVGEKEPKAKWLAAVLGLVTLAAGYYIAQKVSNVPEAIMFFFPAVFLVIIGTYLLFVSGSIAFLKLLKNNKRFYYKTNHFITISNLFYRMKKNAVGLASICILSTMILVMVSSTTSLWFSINDTLKHLYPNEYSLSIHYGYDTSVFDKEMLATFEEYDIPLKDYYCVDYLDFVVRREGDTIIMDDDYYATDPLVIQALTLDNYNELLNTDYKLAEGEVLVYDNNVGFDSDKLVIADYSADVKEIKEGMIDQIPSTVNVVTAQLTVIADDEGFEKLFDVQKRAYGLNSSRIETYYGLDVDETEEGHYQEAFAKAIEDLSYEFKDLGIGYELRSKAYDDLIGFYSGFLFLGSFLGIVFMMAIVLIIYYKQISEGYEDADRFKIMHKVGLSDKEIHKTINSQILMVFFAPLLLAVIHLIAAYHLIDLVIVSLSSSGQAMFVYTFIISTIVFALIYCLIYFITSHTYYKIVTQRN